MRGQKSRSGEGKGTRPGFEGGQTPLYRRLPKIVGKPQKNSVKTEFVLLKINLFNNFPDQSVITADDLQAQGLLTKQRNVRGRILYKVVGISEGSDDIINLKQGLKVSAHAFTKSAREAIESKNGECIILNRTTQAYLKSAEAECLVIE